MRHSILAMLVAFGTTISMSATAQQPSTAQKQMAPSEQPSTAQQQMTPNQQIQNEADKGIQTRNSGESGYVADQERPGASAQAPGRPETTTGSNSGPTGGPKQPR
jgi:hypothetical protein